MFKTINKKIIIIISIFMFITSIPLHAENYTAYDQFLSASESVMYGRINLEELYDYYESYYLQNNRLLTGILRLTQYNESEPNNTLLTADNIPMETDSGNESHMFGLLSSLDTVDYFKITPPRHGRVYVMILSPSGYTYKTDLYNSSGSALPGVTQTSTSKSFIAPKGTTTSGTLATYYIKVSSTTGYSLNNYRVIIFYTLNYENLNWTYPVSQGNSNVSSPVGYRTNPSGYHIGIDLPGVSTNDIISMCNGTIKRAYYDTTYGMGRFVGVLSGVTDEYTNQKYYIRYMHLSSFDDAIIKDVLRNGTQSIYQNNGIGKMGGSGYNDTTYQIHLHVEANAKAIESSVPIDSVINIVDVFSPVNFTGSKY